MTKRMGLLLVLGILLLSVVPAIGLEPGNCGDLSAVSMGEITLSDAMMSCLPDIHPSVLYGDEDGGWISAEDSYARLTDDTRSPNWIILDVRRIPEYDGSVSQVVNQGHPLWLRKRDLRGIGLGNYEHPYLNPWLGQAPPPRVANLVFWERIQQLEEEGKIQKGKTVIIAMCRTAWLAHGAANFLAVQGYLVFNMGTSIGLGIGGYSSWYASGLPTTCNSGDGDCIIAPQYAGYNPYDF